MATDIKIDQVTRDYVDDGAGGWVEINDSSTAVLCQVECRLGKWWGDPTAGSRIKDIMESDLPDEASVFDAFRGCMTVLAQAGQIANLDVSIGQVDSGAGAESFLATWTDRATNKPGDLAYSPLGGNPVVT